MMDKDGNGTLTYDELHESLLSMPGLQSIPRSVLCVISMVEWQEGTSIWHD